MQEIRRAGKAWKPKGSYRSGRLQTSAGAKMKRIRRKIDSALKVKIVFEALRGQKSVVDLARQYGLHPNQIYTWKKQVEKNAVFAFDGRIRQIAQQLQAKVRRVDT
jgi:transposase